MSFCSWNSSEKYRNHFEAGELKAYSFCFIKSLFSLAVLNLSFREQIIRFTKIISCIFSILPTCFVICSFVVKLGKLAKKF